MEYISFELSFANISHELRTPINVIFSTIQLINLNIIKWTWPTVIMKVKEVYGYNEAKCNRLIKIINNLLMYQK